MSTRTYSGTLVLDGVFDGIPASNTILTSIANRVFSPRVSIVEADCGTGLGEVVTLTSNSEGEIQVGSLTPVTPTIIANLLSAGIYEIHIRTSYSCISKGGLCSTCYQAARPGATPVAPGGSVQMNPEFFLDSEQIVIHTATSTGSLTRSTEEYDRVYVYNAGNLVAPSAYTITGSTITLLVNPGVDKTYVVKYTVLSRVPYFYWLAETYSGSLLGVKALPITTLNLKPTLFTSLIPESEIDYLVEKVRGMETVPFEVKEYLPNIKSLMEKALFVIAVDSLFSNVIS